MRQAPREDGVDVVTALARLRIIPPNTNPLPKASACAPVWVLSSFSCRGFAS